MFSNIRIGRRLLLLIAVLTLVFMSVGAVTLIGMSDMSEDTSDLNNKMTVVAEFSHLGSIVENSLVGVGNKINLGKITWQEAAEILELGQKEFELNWSKQLEKNAQNPDLVEFFDDAFGLEVELVRQGYEALSRIIESESRAQLALYMLNEEHEYSEPFINSALALTSLGSAEAQEIFDASESDATLYLTSSVIMVVVGLILAMTLGPLIYVSITSPIKSISGVIEKLSAGGGCTRGNLQADFWGNQCRLRAWHSF